MSAIRDLLRKSVDRFYYQALDNVDRIGTEAPWSICVTPFIEGKVKPVVFSGGAGKDIEFELTMAKKYNATVFLYDPSPTGKKTAERDIPDSSITFYAKALTGKNGVVSLAKPKDTDEGSWSVISSEADQTDEFESVSLSSDIKRLGYRYVDVLKLDIEGFEYEVLHNVLDSDIKVGQILVEFHDFLPSILRQQTLDVIRKLESLGYSCFYKQRHDYSFINKKLVLH